MSAQMPIDFDGLARAKKAAEMGIERAIVHADEVIPDWPDIAREYVLEFLRNVPGPKQFMCWQIRLRAEAMGCPTPPTERSWGHVMRAAAGAKLIRKVGVGPVGDPNGHCANASIWEKA